jgi:hypothetical protein
MSDLTYTEITPDGVTTLPVSALPIGDSIEIELALSMGNYTLACVVCLVPIPSGLGHCYCEMHKPAKYR